MASTEADLNALKLPVTWSQLGSADRSDINAIIEAMNLDAFKRLALVDIWKRHPRQQAVPATELTAEAIAEAVVAKQVEREIARQEGTVVISSATQTKVATLFDRVGLLRTLDDDPAPVSEVHFVQFAWNGRVEDEGLPDARTHLEVQLAKFGVPIGRGGYKVVDVHKNKNLLNVMDDKVGNISGGSDVAIVPYKTAKGGINREICVLFEIKTDDNVLQYEDGLVHFESQALVELLAARCLSYQPGVLVILTDLVSGAFLYKFEYTPDVQGFEVVEKEITLDEMGARVAEFLAGTAVPSEKFRPIDDNNPRDAPCIAFKKAKLSHEVGLALEHFEEMVEDTAPFSRERAQLVASFFNSVDIPMSALVHHSLYC